ncbi:hypothetical protein Tco_0936174 [Tanacetum coccineum]
MLQLPQNGAFCKREENKGNYSGGMDEILKIKIGANWKEKSKALVTVDGESVDWITHSEDNENYAFMASNSSGSNTQIILIERLKIKELIDIGFVSSTCRNKAYLATFKTLMVGPCLPLEGSKG